MAVAALVLAIIAAITIPQVMNALSEKRVSDTYDVLRDLHTAIANTNRTGFTNVVRSGAATGTESAPGRLSHLIEPIVAGNIANFPTSCAATAYNATAAGTWTLGGPFTARMVTASGIRTPIGQIQNTIIRTAVPPTPAHLLIRINSVDPRDAVALDRLVDGDSSPAAGTIQWSVPSGGLTTVDYYIPIFNRC